MLKKTLIVVAVLVAALMLIGVGAAFAQGTQPPQTPFGQGFGMMGGSYAGGRGGYGGMMAGGYGPMHDYVEEALAEKLGLTEAQVEEQLTAGKTMYQIVLDAGIAEADAPALLQEVHQSAFDQAVADGVMTQEQADFMLERMSANGFNYGNCPMGGTAPADGTGFQRGRGGMMGGGRWQQAPQTNP